MYRSPDMKSQTVPLYPARNSSAFCSECDLPIVTQRDPITGWVTCRSVALSRRLMGVEVRPIQRGASHSWKGVIILPVMRVRGGSGLAAERGDASVICSKRDGQKPVHRSVTRGSPLHGQNARGTLIQPCTFCPLPLHLLTSPMHLVSGGHAMSYAKDANVMEFELLRRLGGKWAVLTAMSLTIHKKGVSLPPDINEKLKTARVNIVSGCISPCEVNCMLAETESQLFSQGSALGDEEFMMWSDLLGEAAQGKMDYARIQMISALEPVRQDCRFLGCTCGQA